MTGDSLYCVWMRRLQLFLAATPARAGLRGSGRNGPEMASAGATAAAIEAALSRSVGRAGSSSAAASC